MGTEVGHLVDQRATVADGAVQLVEVGDDRCVAGTAGNQRLAQPRTRPVRAGQTMVELVVLVIRIGSRGSVYRRLDE